ncbi:MAG: glycosyltransferase [Chitinispirillaceae bacterium]|jgi:GT2 family glycosyltransferase
MISVITYCRHPESNSVQERNVAKTIGTEYEYLVIDGSKGPLRYAAAYNWAVTQAKGDIVVFLADDGYFMSMNWGQAVAAKFAQDPALGVIGIAGTQYFFADKYSWTAAGRPFVKGRIVYHLQNGDFFAAIFSNEKGDFEVVACDGCFMAVRAELFKSLRFDEQTFGGPHFYDLDFCLQVRNSARIIVTSHITVKKRSHPDYDEEWNAAGRLFLQKHSQSLPASCVEAVPDPAHIVSSHMVDLKGKASPETIC